MSIVLTARANQFRLREGQKFEIEIFEDGSLNFLDYDIAYDEGGLEFGYPKTEAIKLRELWFSDPGAAISIHFDIPDNILALLAHDYSEHVYYIIEVYKLNSAAEVHTYTHAARLAEQAHRIAIRVMTDKDPAPYGLETVARISAIAAALYEREKFDAAKKTEQDWQRRHFVEVVEKLYGEEP